MEENFDEIWKEIPGYENKYMISNKGCVKSLNYKGTGKERLLKPENCRGYKRVILSKSSKTKMFFIQRLVAEAFLPNPDNFTDVNHKDENKTNNNVNNLEWCSHKYNCNYGTAIQRATNTRNLNNSKGAEKPVLQFTLDGKFLTEYKSISEASRLLHISNGNICSCCRGKFKSIGGFIWKYKD